MKTITRVFGKYTTTAVHDIYRPKPTKLFDCFENGSKIITARSMPFCNAIVNMWKKQEGHKNCKFTFKFNSITK